MENLVMLDILKRIKMFLLDNEIVYARELIQLEIENLKGITEERCKNSEYYLYNGCCKCCSNLNCSSNMNK